MAPEFLMDGPRVLVTAQFAAALTGRPLSTIRDRRCDPADVERGPVACDVATGALYWVGARLGVELAAAIPRPRARTGRKGPVGHATQSSRSAT